MSILNEKMKKELDELLLRMKAAPSSKDKLFHSLLHNIKHPECILKSILRDISLRFSPRNIDQSEVFLKEFIRAAAHYCAVDNIQHLKEHPKEAKICVPEGTEEMGKLFVAIVKTSTIFLCKHDGLENPWEEASINEKLKEELLQEINNDN